MQEGWEERVGGDDAFGLEGADLEVQAANLAVELGGGLVVVILRWEPW